jgi:hypothetical protein
MHWFNVVALLTYSAAPGAPNALHHIIIRGIDRRMIFMGDSEVARRFEQDRSAVSRAARRVDNDPELIMPATTIMEQLKGKVKQR